jgi:exo-beta-1,3-glucanase (GH17 family)
MWQGCVPFTQERLQERLREAAAWQADDSGEVLHGELASGPFLRKHGGGPGLVVSAEVVWRALVRIGMRRRQAPLKWLIDQLLQILVYIRDSIVGALPRWAWIAGILVATALAATTLVVYQPMGPEEPSGDRSSRSEGPSSDTAPPAPEAFAQDLVNLNWVAYGPIGYDPARLPACPSSDSIRADLAAIRDFGWSGIVTFGSSGCFADIVPLADSFGLKVIAGIEVEPGQTPSARQEEVDAAIAQSRYAHVVGYVVGHNSQADDGVILPVIEEIQRKTNKPVSTTRYEAFYSPQLLGRLNWLMIDLGVRSRFGQGTVDEQLAKFTTAFTAAKSLAKASAKPAMIQAVAFPSGGYANYTPASQAQFFEGVFRLYRSEPDYGPGSRVGIVSFTAFDEPWKVAKTGDEGEGWLGLLQVTDGLRTPRPAACHFARSFLPGFRGLAPRVADTALKQCASLIRTPG